MSGLKRRRRARGQLWGLAFALLAARAAAADGPNDDPLAAVKRAQRIWQRSCARPARDGLCLVERPVGRGRCSRPTLRLAVAVPRQHAAAQQAQQSLQDLLSRATGPAARQARAMARFYRCVLLR